MIEWHILKENIMRIQHNTLIFWQETHFVFNSANYKFWNMYYLFSSLKIVHNSTRSICMIDFKVDDICLVNI